MSFDLRKYLVENKLTAGSRLTEANSKPEIKVENDVMYLDYSGSVGTSSFGNLKSPIIKVMKAGEEPRDQKYMIYWKEDSKDWEWERGNMKRQLRNSIISYAKRYLPIIEDQNDLNEPKGSFGEPSDSDYFGNHIKENKLTAGSRLAENRIIIKTNGNRLAIDKKDLQRLKSGKDIVGYSIKYPGQEEWVLAKDKWEIEGPLTEAEKLTYNDFVQMVRDDMMAGASPDEKPSEEQVKKKAKAYYNDYLQGASVDSLFEAKKKAKKNNKKLNKPMRDSSGGKAYKVYVKDPKTKKIKTVRFGSGGLRAKINDKKARNAFAKRHKCAQKKDKTKAGYWSCRLPRYAKLLGLKSNFGGFW